MQADVLVRIKVIRSENRDAMDAVGFKSENRPCPIPLVNKNYPILSQNKKLKFQNHPNIMLSLYPIHPQLSSGDSYDFPPFSNGKIPNCWESTGGNPQHTWNIAIVKPPQKKIRSTPHWFADASDRSAPAGVAPLEKNATYMDIHMGGFHKWGGTPKWWVFNGNFY